MNIASNWSRRKRLLLGIFVLLLVDIIWVASSEITRYIFTEQHFDKPFFTTYLKTSMFLIFLLGFFSKPWRDLACPKVNAEDIDSSLSENGRAEYLSDPVYVPVRIETDEEDIDSDDVPSIQIKNEAEMEDSINRSVRFNSLSEVRCLSASQAEEANLARLSYSAYKEAREARDLASGIPLPVSQVFHLAFIFCVLWFFGSYSYQVALKDTYPGVVNVLSSTSSLFTIILAAIFPGSSADKFSLSKFLAVLVSFAGVVLVCLSDSKLELEDLSHEFPYGIIWALVGALCYSLYIVLLRHRVDREDRLSLPMFFGFVGLLNLALLWPGFFLVHYTGVEEFQTPNSTQWVMISVNGLVGTVAAEILWLWGCFLTSSLLATLSLSINIPLTMLADYIIRGSKYDWMFYLGSIPVFLGFVLVALISHWDHVDPIGRLLGRIFPFQALLQSSTTPGTIDGVRRAVARAGKVDVEPAPYKGRCGATDRLDRYGEQSDLTVGLLEND